MATLSMRPQLSAPAPYVSSPLAGPHHSASARPLARRNPHFAASRPLRPFPSIQTTPSVKPVKLIEPPANFKTTFILDLTQGEFSRQD